MFSAIRNTALAAVAVGLALTSPARAVLITFSSDPFGGGVNPPPVEIGGVPSSGSFGLSPGIHQTETVWSYDIFFNPTSTFSNSPFNLDLTLNGVAGSVPILGSATAFSAQYSFTPGGTAHFDIPGVGIIDVTAPAVVTSISDPADAGPTQADFFLEPAAVPEPASLTVLAMGLAGLGMVLRTRRA